MRHNRLRFCVLFLLGFTLIEIQAQESILTTGGDSSGSGGSISYSIGQVVYTTNTGSNCSVQQGVQHAYKISIPTLKEEINKTDIEISIFPNPTSDYLTLLVDQAVISNTFYQLYNMQGKLIETKPIRSEQTKIVMSNYNPAIYLLKVLHNNKELTKFKISKQ